LVLFLNCFVIKLVVIVTRPIWVILMIHSMSIALLLV
jgi:hypothetical protein